EAAKNERVRVGRLWPKPECELHEIIQPIKVRIYAGGDDSWLLPLLRREVFYNPIAIRQGCLRSKDELVHPGGILIGRYARVLRVSPAQHMRALSQLIGLESERRYTVYAGLLHIINEEGQEVRIVCHRI